MAEYVGDIFGYMSCNGEHKPITAKGVKVKIIKPRNIKHHNQCFGMLGYTLKNMVRRKGITSTDDLLLIFKDIYEFYTPIPTRKGVVKKYYSLKFESMGEDEFQPIAENLKQFCYATLNGDKRGRKVIQGLLDIEFN